MHELFFNLLLALIAGMIVSLIPFDAAIKRVCYIIIGLYVVLLLLSALFGIHLAPYL